MQKNLDMSMLDFSIVTEFEQRIAFFFGSSYAIAVDSCTHGIELCVRYKNIQEINIPCRTYLSIPMLANKLNLPLSWRDEEWQDYYYLGGTNIIDAAVLWGRDTYISNTFMCISFQYQKHLSLGRGGVILLDNTEDFHILKKMSYDGRSPNIPWRQQNIDTFGYHYYMTPEVAKNGLDKLEDAIMTAPKKWQINDWPDLRYLEIFK
jgi:dTDP-4-amino-4,6-dideoxygalactose transaminase